MKLYKEQCSIDARHQFYSNRIVNIWNSLPAAAPVLHGAADLNRVRLERPVSRQTGLQRTRRLRYCVENTSLRHAVVFTTDIRRVKHCIIIIILTPGIYTTWGIK